MNKKISVKNWILIFVMGFAGQLCWAIENNTFATYATKTTGKSIVVTLMVMLSALATTIATFLSGTLGDRKGRRKRLISGGFVLWGIFTIAFGLADFFPKDNVTFIGFYLVLMDCVMSFFGSVGYSGGVNPWTTDISEESNRGQVSTILSGCVVVANIVILGLQGVIVQKYGFLPIFVVMGVLVMILGVISIFVLQDDPDLKPNISHPTFAKQLFSAFDFKKTFANKGLLWVMVTIAVYTVGFNIFMSYATSYLYYYFPVFANISLSKWQASVIEGVGMLLGVVASLIFIRPINKGKTALVTLISVIVSVFALIMLSFTKTVIGLYIFIFFEAFGYVINLQSTTAWFKNLCPENDRGSVEGVKQIFYVLIPMAAGALISYSVIKAVNVTVVVDGQDIEAPTNTLFLVSGLFTILTLIPLYFADKYQKKQGNKA